MFLTLFPLIILKGEYNMDFYSQYQIYLMQLILTDIEDLIDIERLTFEKFKTKKFREITQ